MNYVLTMTSFAMSSSENSFRLSYRHWQFSLLCTFRSPRQTLTESVTLDFL